MGHNASVYYKRGRAMANGKAAATTEQWADVAALLVLNILRMDPETSTADGVLEQIGLIAAVMPEAILLKATLNVMLADAEYKAGLDKTETN